LEEARRCLWIMGGGVQPGHEGGTEMAAHDHERGHAS
jgi:hypothetical protein